MSAGDEKPPVGFREVRGSVTWKPHAALKFALDCPGCGATLIVDPNTMAIRHVGKQCDPFARIMLRASVGVGFNLAKKALKAITAIEIAKGNQR